jgi:hypothetical protein
MVGVEVKILACQSTDSVIESPCIALNSIRHM